jgi:hypothetical protein
MRRVRFPIHDRVVLIPVEIAARARTALLIAAGLLLLSGLGSGGYSLARVRSIGLISAALSFWALLAGAIWSPRFCPGYLVGRSRSKVSAPVSWHSSAWLGML